MTLMAPNPVLESAPARVAVGEPARLVVDASRRRDIMRNHTATHLLHRALREILGEHARQAGSLVAPGRLRFDFTHFEAVPRSSLEEVEYLANRHLADDQPRIRQLGLRRHSPAGQHGVP